MEAATFGWLCVETPTYRYPSSATLAATFGWLCVETVLALAPNRTQSRSYLRVAVC